MQVTDDVDTMLAEGIPFDVIEARIEDYELPQEVKGLLWLYLWVQVDVDDRRRVIHDMMLALRG